MSSFTFSIFNLMKYFSMVIPSCIENNLLVFEYSFCNFSSRKVDNFVLIYRGNCCSNFISSIFTCSINCFSGLSINENPFFFKMEIRVSFRPNRFLKPVRSVLSILIKFQLILNSSSMLLFSSTC